MQRKQIEPAGSHSWVERGEGRVTLIKQRGSRSEAAASFSRAELVQHKESGSGSAFGFGGHSLRPHFGEDIVPCPPIFSLISISVLRLQHCNVCDRWSD